MSVTPHVPVPYELRLPPEFEDVYGYLSLVDPDLRIRRSLEHPSLFVLERRCRRAPAINVGMHVISDMHLQARDGYIHVSAVHANWLTKPWNILRALREDGVDLWVEGGAAKVDDELQYEERWATETRRRRRKSLYQEIAADALPIMQRLNIGGSRMRFNNPGLPKPTHDQFLGRGAPA
jgi:uncharacterized protein (DUF952 family)